MLLSETLFKTEYYFRVWNSRLEPTKFPIIFSRREFENYKNLSTGIKHKLFPFQLKFMIIMFFQSTQPSQKQTKFYVYKYLSIIL